MLIKLQRERQIIIKPCDKGAGIIVLDFKEYLRACIDHLEAKNATGRNYYKKFNHSVLEEAKEKIPTLVKECFNKKILTKE